MKKFLVVLMILLITGSVFADIEEHYYQQYLKKGFINIDDWKSVFNNAASDVSDCAGKIIEIIPITGSLDIDWYKSKFNLDCDQFKALLRIGVELKFIDNKTREQQLAKLYELTSKVSAYYSKKSNSGLGL